MSEEENQPENFVDEEKVAIDAGAYDCEECGKAITSQEDEPVMFSVDCSAHGRDDVVYHRRCLPPHLAEALRQHTIRSKAMWN